MLIHLNQLAFQYSGTLARAPLSGGVPREILDGVNWADWSPDGKNLAVVREAGGRTHLEFPIGKTLYETGGWIGEPRVSPKGDKIAFVDHPTPGDNGGSLAVVDLEGKKKNLTAGGASAEGVAWSPSGQEVWFTATKSGTSRGLYAANLSGQVRHIAQTPGALRLQDISRDGRVLLTRDTYRREVLILTPGDTKQRDLSWFDYSYPGDLSSDGKLLLFDEEGDAGGPSYSVYLRKTDGSPAVRLGEGSAGALSPDGKWALTLSPDSASQLVLLPIGAGQPKPVTHDGINHLYARWLPGEKGYVFTGNEPGHGVRVYVQDPDGRKPQPISPEGVLPSNLAVSPDGKEVAAVGPDRKVYSYKIAGGESRPIPGSGFGERPISWSADGRFLYLYPYGDLPSRVYRLDAATGQRLLLKEIMPADAAGVTNPGPILFTPDGATYVYGYNRSLSDLYVVEGFR